MISQTIIRYISVHPSAILTDGKFELWQNTDGAMLDILNDGIKIYPRTGQVDEDLAILKVAISPALEKEIEKQVDIENPFSEENASDTVLGLDIPGRIFLYLSQVRVAHPQTAGTITITDTAEDGIITTREISKINEDAKFYKIADPVEPTDEVI